MAKIEGIQSVFHTFAYNFDDPNGLVKDLSANTVDHMERMPPLITKWQAEDIAANNVGGYYENPMETIGMNIMMKAMDIVYISTNVTNLTELNTKSLILANTANTFMDHTDRLSGVTPFNGMDTEENPYLDLAMGLGKTVMYIVYQTDGIMNNAPIMGSFTSLLIEPQLTSNLNSIITFVEPLRNSIVANTVTVQVDDGNGGYVDQTTTTYSSNLASQSITSLTNQIHALTTFMEYRRQSDRDYYVNMKGFIDKYNKTKKFNKMGATESDMTQNLIGSQKLLDRLNS